MIALNPITMLTTLALLSLVPFRSSDRSDSGQLPGIISTDHGSASEPAQSATLQFFLGSSQAFGMGGPMMESVEVAPGTPGAGEPAAFDPFGSAALTEEQLDPIVDALVAAGASEDAIEITVPVFTSYFGPGVPGAGEIEVMIDQPSGDQLVELVGAVTNSAPDSGLTVLHVGAEYEAADCAALIQQARDAAIADARERAAGLVTGLGVTVVELVQVSESPYFGSPEAGSCAPEGTETFYGPFGPGTYPEFDPESAEGRVSVQVTLTFAFGEAA